VRGHQQQIQVARLDWFREMIMKPKKIASYQRLRVVRFSRRIRHAWPALIQQLKSLLRKTKRSWLKFRWDTRPHKALVSREEASDVLGRIGVSVINLESRQDRIAEFSHEMAQIEITDWRRVEAIDGRAEFPGINPFFSASIGCTLSHIAALDSADWLGKDAWMICEDDAELLLNRDDLSSVLSAFLENPSLDVLALYGRARGASHHIGSGLRISMGIVGRVCYVVKPHMKTVLIKEFSAGVPLLLEGIRKGKGDQMWRKLQRSTYFFATPAMPAVRNRSGYSDIEGKVLGAR